MRCDECRKIHHELPDIMVPRKRYEAQVIEEAISKQDSAAPCEESTLRRWKRWFALLLEYFKRILEMMKCFDAQSKKFQERLEEILFTDPQSLTAGWLKDLVRIGVNNNRWPQTRTAFQSI